MDGENYAGIRAFSYGDKEPRSYVSAKLKVPLTKDAMYCVTFYVSLAEASKYACNNIGMNFSKNNTTLMKIKRSLHQHISCTKTILYSTLILDGMKFAEFM
jgi:hypothetical protein